jgi:hypothetical protein
MNKEMKKIYIFSGKNMSRKWKKIRRKFNGIYFLIYIFIYLMENV